ncbi:MAG: hypothetical protein Alpg2KO_28130 [Alphaproteobacteria bacterium]
MIHRQGRKRHTAHNRGVTAVSYGLIVGLISVVALVAVTGTGDQVDSLFDEVSGSLAAVSGSAGVAQSATPQASPTPPADCPLVGDVCPDGSIHFGFSLDDGQPIYVTRCDLGMSHDGSSCTGVRDLKNFAISASAFNLVDSDLDDGDVTGPTSDVDGAVDGWESYDSGRQNTALLVTLDASTDPGFQSFEAAAACDGLSLHGHSDWYLPAQGELTMLHAAIIASGPHRSDFKTTYGGLDGHILFSSTETSSSSAAGWDITGGNPSSIGKSSPVNIRCVRH